MLPPNEERDAEFDDEPTTPECHEVVARIQRALDGDASPDALDANPHLGACAACRERVQAARVLLSVLARPEPVRASTGFTDRVLNAVRADRQVHARRQRAASVAGVLALAAAVLVGAWFIADANTRPKPVAQPNSFVQQPAPQAPEIAPEPRAKEVAPEPRPIRIGDEFAKAGQALRDAPKPITDSVASAPKLFDALTSAFTKPEAPMGGMLEPARKSLAELPDAARHGLEPVTGTAQKAFDRLLRDVASVKPKS